MGYRAIDIQTVAQIRFLKENGKFKTKEGKNDMHLSAVMEMCKIKDPRKRIAGGKIIKEGTPHNALEDAKLTAECFSRIVYGKKLLNKYLEYEMPQYLIK